MLAVLEDAIDCYRKYAFAKDGPGRQLFADASGWISCDDRGWCFSFENICEALEINPDYLRRGMQKWRRRCLEHAQARGDGHVPHAAHGRVALGS